MIGFEKCFQLPSVTALDLSKNPNFGDNGLRNFLSSYRISNKKYYLKSLCLRNVGLDGNLKTSNITSGLYQLCQFLISSNTGIIDLDLSENHFLCDEGAKMIIRALKENNTVENLNLAETHLSSSETSSCIADFLIHNKVQNNNYCNDNNNDDYSNNNSNNNDNDDNDNHIHNNNNFHNDSSNNDDKHNDDNNNNNNDDNDNSIVFLSSFLSVFLPFFLSFFFSFFFSFFLFSFFLFFFTSLFLSSLFLLFYLFPFLLFLFLFSFSVYAS